MKKILLLLFLSVCLLVKAQMIENQENNSLENISIGFKGGINSSWAEYSEHKEYKPEAVNGNLFGIFAEFGLNKESSFSIRPELLFLSRGTEIKRKDKDVDYSIAVDYVDFRLPLIWNIGNKNKVRPYLYAAPTLSFTQGGDIKLNDYETDISDGNFSSFDFGITGGAGIRIPVEFSAERRIYLGLEAAYHLGLTDTYSKDEKDGESQALNQAVYEIDGSRKFQGWEVTASISIPLSNFKKKKAAPAYVPPVRVEQPQLEVTPVPVEEEKPCYTLEEIMGMIDDGKTIIGKTICAVDVINFEFGKSSLDKPSFEYLDKIITLLKKSDFNMQIIGHTDNVGTDEFNMELSKKRAEAVYNYLIKHGVERSRLSYSYFGMRKPIASNDTEDGRLINRRVEFRILNK